MKKDFKKNFKKPNKNFRKEAPKYELKKIFIEEISLNLGKKVSIVGAVNRVIQTGGPTIFVVTDGTGSLSLKGFIRPGERAYPEINEGDVVRAVIEVGEYQGEIEGEISSIKKLDDTEKKNF